MLKVHWTLVAAAALVVGCANIPAQTNAAADQGCKIVVYDSASQSIRADVADMRRAAAGTAPAPVALSTLDQADGSNRIGNIQNRDRRFDTRNVPNTLNDARRGC